MNSKTPKSPSSEPEDEQVRAQTLKREEKAWNKMASARVDHWIKRDRWSVHQMAFLLKNKEPIEIDSHRWVFFPYEFQRHYTDLKAYAQDILSAIPSNELDGLYQGMDYMEIKSHPARLLKWAQSKGIDIPPSLLAVLEEDTEPTGIDTTDFSDELKIAISAGKYVATLNNPKHGYKTAILTWLEKHHPMLSNAARDRITTVVNPNKSGGASKTI